MVDVPTPTADNPEQNKDAAVVVDTAPATEVVTDSGAVTYTAVSSFTPLSYDALTELKGAVEKITGFFTGGFYQTDAQQGVAVLNQYGLTFTL